MNVAYLCDKGLVREENEDCILLDEEEKFFILADGMGGHEKGYVASSMVVNTFRELPSFMKKMSLLGIVIKDRLEEQLNLQIAKVSNELITYSQKHQINEIIGSTLVGLYKCPFVTSWAIFHMGDSRAYHYSNAKLTQLTLDHATGKNTSNVISRAIGNFTVLPLELNYFSPQKGDYLILCSDGVSDYMSHQELLIYILKYHHSLALLCQYIKELIYQRGAKDNLSLIIVEVEGD